MLKTYLLSRKDMVTVLYICPAIQHQITWAEKSSR